MLQFSEIDGFESGDISRGDYSIIEFLYSLENEKENSFLDFAINQGRTTDKITVTSSDRTRPRNELVKESVEIPANRTGERLFGAAYDKAINYTTNEENYDPANGIRDALEQHISFETDESKDENAARDEFFKDMGNDISGNDKAKDHITNGSIDLIMNHFSPEQQGRLFGDFIKNGCK